MNTVEEIAQDVFNNLEDGDAVVIRTVPNKEGMIRFHHNAGMAIRNKYGLWKEGHPLTANGEHPDDVSAEILRRVWELCQ